MTYLVLKMANVLENFFSRGIDFKGDESVRINFSPNRLVTDIFMIHSQVDVQTHMSDL